WDAETLRWRLENPAASYRLRRHGDRVQVYARSGRPGIDVALGEVDGGLVGESVGRAPGPLRIWLGVDPRRNWSRAPYWNLPPRLRPAPLNVLFK
ncbi:MAG: hypothetical protein GWO02_04610, partial [Gammaproteobacteria bacterium]|nr:hypothetical protein [Gammaproteobacteria bacterium]